MPIWWYAGLVLGVIPWALIAILISAEAQVIGLIIQIIGLIVLAVGNAIDDD